MSIDTQDWVANWSSGLAGKGVAKYKKKIAGYTGNPMQLAAAQADKYVRNTQKAVSEHRYQNSLTQVPVDVWKTNAQNQGANHLIEASSTKKSRVLAVANAMKPDLEALQSQVNALPNQTDSDTDARMLAWKHGAKLLKGKYAGVR